jgi:ABC-2 type transport system permease protein
MSAPGTKPGTLAWFARHEFRLAWRDGLAMMTAGRRTRARTLVIALAVFALFMHGVAFAVVSRFAYMTAPDKTTLVVVTGSVFLAFALLLSQAMESVTRVFYARSDLDLLLSSPAAAERIFAVRVGTIALSVMAMAALLSAPFIDVLAMLGGAHWLTAYGAVVAVGAAAAAIAAVVTTALFETIGAKRTRLVAQIVAAVIGAGFVIALQLAAIISTGTLSRFALLASAPFVAVAPDASSAVWWPARAVFGDPMALAAMAGASLLLLALSIALAAPRFAHCAVAAAGVAGAPARQNRRRAFRAASPAAMLRRKEWTLLRRDPWLMSQTLMQLLYLVPPAFLLWRSFGSGAEAVLVPVLVMAAGQLAGGLAWLAVSGEDAPDLVATAPLRPGRILRAKTEAVMGVIVAVFAPLIVALALASPFHAAVAAAGILSAAASAAHIQLCFRAQAKRSHFRRRQTSSRIATFAEAFVSIGWAATAALAANDMWIAAAFPAAMAAGILAGARHISPHKG